jgi:6-phosphogluconate dehydrogenase
MRIGMIGLGRMGGSMARRLVDGGHECVVFDLESHRVEQAKGFGAEPATSNEEVVAKLDAPRVVWVMVPHKSTDGVVNSLAELLEAGDTVIDGGNSHFKDDVRRATAFSEYGIRYLDVGTSGGVWGLERGYCLMIGGDRSVAQDLDPIFRTLAPGCGAAPTTPGRENRSSTAEEGYVYCGPSGAGHFVKMLHNGIEYGLMQAYAEGFHILSEANSKELPEEYRYDFDLPEIAEVWRRGSVIGSWLLDLVALALAEDRKLSRYSGFVEDSGEGRWTIQAAIEEAVPAEVLSAALYARFRSRHDHTFGEKLLSAMRDKFGGHEEDNSS